MSVNEVGGTPPLEEATPEQESSKFANSNENIAPKRSFFKSFFQRNLSIRKASYAKDLRKFIDKSKSKIGQKNEMLRIIENFADQKNGITKGELKEAKKIIKNLKEEAYGSLKERKSNYKNLVELVERCQCKNDLPKELTNLVKKGKNSKISNLAYKTAEDIIKKTEDLNKTKEALRSAGYAYDNNVEKHKWIFIGKHLLERSSWDCNKFIEIINKETQNQNCEFIDASHPGQNKYDGYDATPKNKVNLENVKFESSKLEYYGIMKICGSLYTNAKLIEVFKSQDDLITICIPIISDTEIKGNAYVINMYEEGSKEKLENIVEFFPHIVIQIEDNNGSLEKDLVEMGIDPSLRKKFESQYNELQNATDELNKLLK